MTQLQNYDVKTSKVWSGMWYDLEKVDVENEIRDFTFAFRHNKEPIDMLAQEEYFQVRFRHQQELSEESRKFKDIGLNDCTQDAIQFANHFMWLHSSDMLAHDGKWGTTYCANRLNVDKRLLGGSKSVIFPMHRLEFSILKCDAIAMAS